MNEKKEVINYIKTTTYNFAVLISKKLFDILLEIPKLFIAYPHIACMAALSLKFIFLECILTLILNLSQVFDLIVTPIGANVKAL